MSARQTAAPVSKFNVSQLTASAVLWLLLGSGPAQAGAAATLAEAPYPFLLGPPAR